MEEDNNKPHNYYVVETDLIEAAGPQALKTLGEEGNIVYLPFDRIEKAAESSGRYSPQYNDTLKFLTRESKFEDGAYILPTEGKVIPFEEESADNQENSGVVITRSPSKESKYQRKGWSIQFPEFLRYGTDALSEGYVSVNYNGTRDNKIDLESFCEETGHTPVNNQFIQINGTGDLYKVQYPLEATNDRKTRFRIKEDEGYLERYNADSIKPPGFIKDFELRGLEQKLAYDILTDQDVEMALVSGGSGSGKTILSYVAAIEQILGPESQRPSNSSDKEKNLYEGIVLFKPSDIIGGPDREEGYLPGTAYQKAQLYLESFVDAHRLSGLKSDISFRELLADPEDPYDEMGQRTTNGLGNSLYLPNRNKAIEIGHLRFARGRTFENSIVLVDEAQNFTPFEMKQLVERVGEGSKLMVIGDNEQVDNPRLDSEFNGLVYAANSMIDNHPRYASIYLGSNYRSQSAEVMRQHRAPLD